MSTPFGGVTVANRLRDLPCFPRRPPLKLTSGTAHASGVGARRAEPASWATAPRPGPLVSLWLRVPICRGMTMSPSL